MLSDGDQLIESHFDQEVVLPLGRTLVLRPPVSGSAWQLDFASEVLQLLTPPAQVQAPGDGGWRFKALAAGVTDVTATLPTAQTGSRGSLAPPRRFTVAVRVP